MNDDLKALLIKHEALRLKPYKDTVGKLTIGVGRNLDDKGISEDEAMIMLANDVAGSEKEASNFSWFGSLSQARQNVIVSMIFNMGLPRFENFKHMIAALESSDFATAADEMRNSAWASQIGERCEELASMMESG